MKKKIKHFRKLQFFTILLILGPVFAFSQGQSVALVDDFNIFPNNSYGLESNGFSSHPGKALIQLTTARGFEAYLHSGKSLRIEYDLEEIDTSFVVFSTSLPLLDLTDENYLSFWVKGSQGREYFSVELKRIDTKSAKVSVWDYLDCGPTDDWKKVVIPLDAFWNLAERTEISQLNFVFEAYQSSQNDSPLNGEVLLDEIIFGNYFTGLLKIDSFNDKVGSNPTGANNGAFAKSGSSTLFTSNLKCKQPFELDCNCQQRINYDVSIESGDEFGGTFYILGGDSTGFIGVEKDLSKYDELYIEIEANTLVQNPGNVKLELKSGEINYSHRILGITDRTTGYTVPFNDFTYRPPFSIFSSSLDATKVNQFAIVFEQNRHDEPKGSIIIDNIEFRSEGKEFPDASLPNQASIISINNYSVNEEIILNSSDHVTVEINVGEIDERLESLSLEYRRNCDWYRFQVDYAPILENMTFTFNAGDLPTDIPLEIRVVKENYQGLKSVSVPIQIQIKGDPPLTANQLLKYSFEAIHYLRYETGVYLDAVVFEGEPFHPASVATTGMGLISLCIGDAMGYINNAEELAHQTLISMTGGTNNFEPERNKAGWFRHFIDQNTGKRASDSEFSSIDSGILVAGALFCKNYFKHNAKIAELADSLYLTTAWNTMIADPETGGIYLESGEECDSGNGITLPFNEYMLVAWLAKHDLRIDSSAWQLWEKHYADPATLPRSTYEGIDVLTDNPGNFLSNFVPQFVYFLCNYFTASENYLSFFTNAMKADSLWWRNNTNTDCYVWGFGAGASTTSSGYHADDIKVHPSTIASPHIIGGFIPANPNLIRDLVNLYITPLGLYEMPNAENIPILWRFSYDEPTWRANDIQGIDFSSMMLGLAAHPDALGRSFFEENNNFDFPSSIDGIGGLCSTDIINNNLTRDSRSIILKQNHPNPFEGSTIIEFEQSRAMEVILSIIDIRGRIIFRNELGILPPGEHQVMLDVSEIDGMGLAPGIYFYKLETPHYFDIKKMSVIN